MSFVDKVAAIRGAPRRSCAFEMLNQEAQGDPSIMEVMIKGQHVPSLRMVRMLRRFSDAGLFEDSEIRETVRRAVFGAAAIVTPMHYLYAITALLDLPCVRPPRPALRRPSSIRRPAALRGPSSIGPPPPIPSLLPCLLS